MSDGSTTFACDGCGRQYRWNEKLAGRKVRCKCGDALAVPDVDPAVSLPMDDALSDLAAGPSTEAAPASSAGDTSKCPLCNSRVSRDAVICINCGADMRTGRRLETKRSEAFVTGEGGGASGAMRAVQVGLLMQLGAIALGIFAFGLGVASALMGSRFEDYVVYADYAIAALQAIGAALCLATPKESGGRVVLAVSLLTGFCSGIVDGLVEGNVLGLGAGDDAMTIGLGLLSGLLSIVSTICFLAFFIKLAQFLEFPEITERAEKVMQLYVGLLIASFATIIPFIGCFAGLLILGLAIYAGVLYLLLLIDLNKGVAYRIAEAS